MSNSNTAFIEYIYGQLKSINYSRGSDGAYEQIEEIIDDIQAHLETQNNKIISIVEPDSMTFQEICTLNKH